MSEKEKHISLDASITKDMLINMLVKSEIQVEVLKEEIAMLRKSQLDFRDDVAKRIYSHFLAIEGQFDTAAADAYRAADDLLKYRDSIVEIQIKNK